VEKGYWRDSFEEGSKDGFTLAIINAKTSQKLFLNFQADFSVKLLFLKEKWKIDSIGENYAFTGATFA
jgi:hypothetical protein